MTNVASLSFESTEFNIEKLDGTNFPLQKEQIYNVLVQKKQVKPINLRGVKPENMDQEEWAKMDKLTRSIIMLSMTKTVYYNVNKCVTSYDLQSKLCTIYSQKNATSQIYWLKQFVDLKMKHGASMSSHLREFNSIFDQLSGQGIELNDSLKALFLLITLPDSQDTFCTIVSTNATIDGLSSMKVDSSLLTKEVQRKNVETSRNGSALVVCGRSNERGKGKERNKSQSKSRGQSNVECYHCHNKGHLKKD